MPRQSGTTRSKYGPVLTPPASPTGPPARRDYDAADSSRTSTTDLPSTTSAPTTEEDIFSIDDSFFEGANLDFLEQLFPSQPFDDPDDETLSVLVPDTPPSTPAKKGTKRKHEEDRERNVKKRRKTEPAEEPVGEPPEHVTEPAEEPVEEPVGEPMEHVTEPTEEPVEEPVGEPM